ncbi:MAG: carboxylating nicotinate-nucleotide diphosphorylase [Rhodospirillaceae bacterium]|nr:carboxylating nicotinate-nucleotide diphosphorylase [Rhodospirillaceae bacterium]
MIQPPIPDGIDEAVIERIIQDALDEDLGLDGDITSYATIAEDVRFSGVLSAREQMVVAGINIAARVFSSLSDDIKWSSLVKDGDIVEKGKVLAGIEGPARALLAGERTALNLLQHLSGIATTTRQYVDAIKGTNAVILDTRKTIPGLRDLAKYATRMGGATNHRMRLDDAVLIKDNHIIAAGGVAAAIKNAKAAKLSPIEVECDTMAQVEEALHAGVDAILLDNMNNDALSKAVKLINGRARSEASGGVHIENVRAIAETGVDAISIGRITQSAPAVDIGLDWAANQFDK